MKKLTAVVIAIAALSVGALAQAKPAQKTEVKCPIMPTHKVKIADATKAKMFADYKGRRYFFCCAGCLPEFNKNKEKYAKKFLSESIPTPKPAKK